MATPLTGQIANFRGVLRIRDYRQLWGAQVVSTFGDRLTQLAITALVYKLTGSEASVGLVLSLTMLPQALLGLPAGAVADRYSRKTLLVATDIARAILIFVIALWANVPIAAVYLLTALHATATVFFAPARYAVLPDIVGPHHLMEANTLDETSQSALDPVAYLLGGFLIALVGTRVSFGLDSLTFVISAMFIASTTPRRAAMWRAPRDEEQAGFSRGMWMGLHILWEDRLLRANTLLMLLATLAASSESPLTYMLVYAHWHTGAWGLGVVEGGLAVGIVAGSLLCGPIVARIGKGRSILIGLLLTGLSMIAIGHLPFWPAAFVIAVSGIFNMLFYVPTVTLQQQLAPAKARGRVLSARRALNTFTIFCSYILATALVSTHHHAASVMTVLGALLFAIASGGFAFPELRTR